MYRLQSIQHQSWPGQHFPWNILWYLMKWSDWLTIARWPLAPANYAYTNTCLQWYNGPTKAHYTNINDQQTEEQLRAWNYEQISLTLHPALRIDLSQPSSGHWDSTSTSTITARPALHTGVLPPRGSCDVRSDVINYKIRSSEDNFQLHPIVLPTTMPPSELNFSFKLGSWLSLRGDRDCQCHINKYQAPTWGGVREVRSFCLSTFTRLKCFLSEMLMQTALPPLNLGWTKLCFALKSQTINSITIVSWCCWDINTMDIINYNRIDIK